MEKFFKLKENNTTVKTEILAGFTTFMTMAYILAVNPQILSVAGLNGYGVLVATALSSAIACFCMAAFANYPFALAPAMGVNAVFTYTFVIKMNIPWQVALLGVFVEGVIFILLSAVNVREAIFNAIPMSVKYAISVGLGLFIAFVGMQSSGIIVDNSSTLVSFNALADNFSSSGLTAVLALLGVVVIAGLLIKGVKSGIFIGIIVTWGLGIILELIGVFEPATSCIPKWSGYEFSGFNETFLACFKVDFSGIKIIDFIVLVFTFLFMDMFDTIGTLIGVSAKANMLDKDGKLPRIKGALFADAVGTVVGALFGTSTVGTYVESASGVTQGGRTGLTAVTVGVLFLLSLFFSPIFIAIPSFATAPALIIVGVYMISSVSKIDFSDFSEGVPAFITIALMPFSYSISDGIFMGVISYVFINLICGKHKKITPVMYILCMLFIIKYMFL